MRAAMIDIPNRLKIMKFIGVIWSVIFGIFSFALARSASGSGSLGRLRHPELRSDAGSRENTVSNENTLSVGNTSQRDRRIAGVLIPRTP